MIDSTQLKAVGLLGWGIRPSQGLCHQFSSLFLVLQSDSNLGLCRRGFLNPS